MPSAARLGQTLLDLCTSARFVVDGDSMLPALAGGESVLAVRTRFSWNLLRRGDIVVLQHPVWKDHTYIKRIVGLPNEDILLEDGLIYLSGNLLQEAYLEGLVAGGSDDRQEWWLGPEEYLVLGDNRNDSQDSRAFGPIDQRLILGRIWLRCWPPRSWGRISGQDRAGS